MTYTGRERRWMVSREWGRWIDRDAQSANQSALEYARDAEILLKVRNRAKNRLTQNALWNGYWQLKEKRDHFRMRVAKEVAPWFDGSAFDSGI